MLELRCSVVSVLDPSRATLAACGLPGVLPSFVPHAMAQGAHGIDRGASPSPPAPFASGFSHECVRTLDPPGTAGPAGSSKQRRAHQAEPFAHRAQVLAHRFPTRFAFRQAIGHPGQGSGATMFEEGKTAVEQVRRKDVPTRMQRLQQRTEVFSGMGNSEKPNHILAMDVHQCLEPICSVPHGTPLVGLDHLASARLDLGAIRTMGGIRQARDRGKVSHVDLLGISRASRNLPKRQGTDGCPCFSAEGNHRSIRADHHARGVCSLLGFVLPGTCCVERWLVLNGFADCFAEPAGRFWADEDSQQVVENLTGMPTWHPPPQAPQRFLLPRSQGARTKGSFLIPGGNNAPHTSDTFRRFA